MASKNRWSRVREGFRTQLWPIPLIGVVLAIAAGVVMPRVDRALADVLPLVVRDYLFGGGPGQASEVLATIAGSLITVTSLTFSLTVVTLQLASSQYSPRLLRTFARDRFVQLTLALFLSTFAYALVVLRTIRVDDDRGERFVPQVAVTVAYLLALASVLALVLFLAHLVREIRVETMLSTVGADAKAASGQSGEDGESPSDPFPAIPAHGSLITARGSGFLTTLDEEGLLETAQACGAVIAVTRMPGDWIVQGTPVACVWPSDPGLRFTDDQLSTLTDRIAAGVHTADERTPIQDVGYGLRQLVDVAVRALSPGINDPTTAVHALRHTATLLTDYAQHRLGPTVLRSGDDVIRLAVRRPELADLLDLAMTQPRLYGSQDPVVLVAMFALLRDVAWQVTDPDGQTAIIEQLDALRRSAGEQNFGPGWYERLADAGRAVEAAMTKTWLPSS